MQFPNACEGVKKIYKAEIIALIGAICGLLAAILGVIGPAAGSVGGLGSGTVPCIPGPSTRAETRGRSVEIRSAKALHLVMQAKLAAFV